MKGIALMNKKSFRQRLVYILNLFAACLLLIVSANAQGQGNDRQLDDEVGGQLYSKFKTAKALPCGQRDEAIKIGKEIIEKYGDDKDNKSVIDFVRQDIPKIEQADRICRRNNRYDNAYKSKNWNDFFLLSKEIIAEEGDTPLALDVILTLVSFGYDRAAVEKIDIYNSDTLNFAHLAIQRIEAGQKSKTARWGVFVPFISKENALCWMNYIIGWQMYYKLNRKKEALVYLYKSTQIGSEKKNDISIYTNIGTYYLDESIRLSAEQKEKLKSNSNVETEETKALLALARGMADRAMDAFGRAYKSAVYTKQKELIDALRKTLNDLYLFRFQPDIDKYIKDLITQPMPDPTTRVEPVSEDPIEIKILRNKSQ
jgi:hypothetical protein